MDILFQILMWLPGIVLFLCIFARYIWPNIMRVWIKNAEEKGVKCDVCKGQVMDREEYLFLIPSSFDAPHVKDLQYYINNGRFISDVSQIPTGNRACRMAVTQCQNCGRREVVVIDFLRVRDSEVFKGAEAYPYEQLRGFLEQFPVSFNATTGAWDNANSQGSVAASPASVSDSSADTKYGIHFPRV